jgi:hypothetical protein
MKRFLSKSLLLGCLTISILILWGCTVSRDFGPYQGRVIDYDTGEPIEGAVIFYTYRTEFVLSPAGPVPKTVGTVEQLTNSNGGFNLPSKAISSFSMFHRWDQYHELYIYKPGYALFPSDKTQTSSSVDLINNNLPVDKHITIKIKKLKTVSERRTNLNMIHTTMLSLPGEMTKLIDGLIEEEEKYLLDVEASKK